ncbi:MAG: DUF4394 domain-containing protein [Ignavibacteria bacterium]
MRKIILVFMLILSFILNAQAQDKSTKNQSPSVLPAPMNSNQNIVPINPSPSSYNSRFFGDVVGATSQQIKSFLNTPTVFTNVGGSTTRNLFGGAIITATGVYYGAEYIGSGSANLVTIDTSTGAYTTIGPMSGLSGGHTITGIAWDKSTTTMYALSTNGSVGTLYTCNITNGTLTPVGSTTGSLLPIDLAINNAGVIYSIDIGTDVLQTLNKTTGAATTIGPLGVDLNFAQGMGFDGSTDSLYTASYLTAGTSGLYKANLTTGALTLIGNFPAASEVDAFVIPGGLARPLNPFNLLTPAANARIVTVAGSTTPVVITWDTSAGGASYRFVFGNPVVPPRRFSIPSTQNNITTTLGALDIILGANGFTNNGSATDSAVGQWNVWAYKGSGAPGADSLAAANGPRAITLRRQQVTLTPFSLSAPNSPITIITSPVDLTPINFIWTRSGVGSSYRWLYKTGATYSDPATLRFPSNNGGLDTIWSVRNSRLDSLVAGLGINPGDSVTGVWRVRSFSSSDSLNSNAPDRTITFRRAGLLPLNQDFVDVTFPPPFWTLADGGATQYWTRNAVGGYNIGVGSAKYDFWTAGTTTPLQTLTSNQFPAVITPNNYLRFNYSQAFYLSGTTLAPDSCIVEGSTDNGTSWTVIMRMGASQTLSSGYNSSGNMTTVGGPFPGAFTPTAANQWATKIFPMPVGTNKVRFVGKSGFGNNLYIDNITSGTATGSGNTPVTIIPNTYELTQNYPNPFNPVTRISFSLPKQTQITLKVYDILGKEIATLVNEVKPAGTYDVNFNASSFSSGVYFYKIEADNFTDIKRMMLIK